MSREKVMKLADLPTIEREAIDLLLQADKTNVLRSQLSDLTSVRREESGSGVFINFDLGNLAGELTNAPSFRISEVFANSSDGEEIGFILFVRNGSPDYLEGYVYSDVYPAYETSDFVLTGCPLIKGDGNN